jgi:hypothetical protein
LKNTLYIHFGTGKTGTSAIQNFLSNNDKTLSEKGIKYIETLRWGGGHHPLAWILHYKHSNVNLMDTCSASFIEQREKYLDELAKENAMISGKSIVISSEIFPFLNGDAIDELLSLFPKMPVKAIFYIRNIRDQSLSLAAEVVKFKSSSTNDERISNIYDNHLKLFYNNYLQCLNLMEKKIGKDNLIFRRYGYEYFKNGNIFADILEVLNLSLTDEFILTNMLSNESLTYCETIYFKDLMNRLSLSTSQNELINALLLYEKENNGLRFYLPKDTMQKIEKSAVNINKYLLESYLDESFSELLNKKISVNERPDYELMHSTLTKLIDYMENQINGFKNDFYKSMSGALDRTYEYEIRMREFENILKNLIRGKMSAAMWGCGEVADKLFRNHSFLKNTKIYVVDKNSEKQGTLFWGHEVLSPAAITEKNIDTVIITSVVYADDIYHEIRRKYQNVKKIIKVSGLHTQIGMECIDC